MKNKLLAFCDSPTCQTGFGRVAQNLFTRWHASGFFEEIWVWGIGYSGFPHDLPLYLCPAATARYPLWHGEENLNRFLLSLDNDQVGKSEGGYTHLWIMQDTFAISPMAMALRKKAAENNIKTLLYYPVDAPLEPSWTDIIAAVDIPVAYCQYGLEQTRAALSRPGKDSAANNRRLKAIPRLRSLPHGVDTAVYRPIDLLDGAVTRVEARRIMFGDAIKPEDFLICVVSQNQKRKGHHLALQVVRLLKEMWPDMRPKLYMHLDSANTAEGTFLDQIATNLGLVVGRDVFFPKPSMFQNGHPTSTEQQLNAIYNTADLLLTTTYGEGWGLPITEAMAAGLPVAAPNHSSISNILGADLPPTEQRGILFDTEGFEVIPSDNSRLRPRPDIQSAAQAIAGAWQTQKEEPESPLSLRAYRERASAWITAKEFSWDHIAAQWLELMH